MSIRSRRTASWSLFEEKTEYSSYAVKLLNIGSNYVHTNRCSVKFCNTFVTDLGDGDVVYMMDAPKSMMGNVVVDGVAYQVVGTQRFGFPAYNVLDSNISVEQSAYPDLGLGQLYYYGGWLIRVADLDTDSTDFPLWVLQVDYGTYSQNIWHTLANSHTAVYAYRVIPVSPVKVFDGSYTTVSVGGTRAITLPFATTLFSYVDLDIQYSTVRKLVRIPLSDLSGDVIRTESLGVSNDTSAIEYFVRVKLSQGASKTRLTVELDDMFQRSSSGQLTAVTGSVYIQKVYLVP